MKNYGAQYQNNYNVMHLKIPVLAYHAANVFGDEYNRNDNVALKHDLQMILELGIEIISAHKLVDFLNSNEELDSNKRYVVITFDDGNNLDFIDSQYPDFGLQPSFFSRLKESPQYTHATSFAIASPVARAIMENTCLQGFALLSENWWQQAQDSGLLSIENHSWDHLHPTLETVRQKHNIKGDFSQIDTFEEAESQIRACSEYIDTTISSKKTSLFAYPYGHYNDYLTDEYFPKQQSSIKAAFTCEPHYVTEDSNIWKLPRFVCGCDWKSQDEFKQILLGIR